MPESLAEHKDSRSTLQIAAELKNLAPLRDFVGQRARALGMDQAAVSDLTLATDEAVTNVIVHGCRGEQGSIEVTIKQENADVVIYIRDHAPPFDPTMVPAPDLTRPLEQRSPGGLGMFLIRQCVDEVTYRELPDGGNELVLRKARVVRGTI